MPLVLLHFSLYNIYFSLWRLALKQFFFSDTCNFANFPIQWPGFGFQPTFSSCHATGFIIQFALKSNIEKEKILQITVKYRCSYINIPLKNTVNDCISPNNILSFYGVLLYYFLWQITVTYCYKIFYGKLLA